MKKLYKETMVIGTAAAVLLLCGCSEQQEEQQAATDGRVSNISVSVSHGATRTTAGATATRATAADMASVGRLSAFKDDDTFLAFMPTAARHTSAPYQVSSSGGDTYAATVCAGYEPLSAPSVDGTPLYGYYPYSTDGTAYGGVRVTDATATFTVQQDQTTAAAYEQSDLMYASGTVTASGVASLAFSHQMAQLVLRPYSASDYTDGTDGHPTLTMKSLEIVSGSRTVALATMPQMTIGETRGDAMTPAAPLQVFSGSQALSYYADQTTAGATTGGATPYYCLVPPQQLSQSTAFIRLECEASYGGGAPQTFSVTYRLTADRTLASGSSYTLPLPVTPVATDVEIAAWTESDWAETTDLDYDSGNYANSGNMAFTVGGVPFNMVYVEGGHMKDLHSSQMRSPVVLSGYHATLSDYYIAETETTQALYKAVMGGLMQTYGGTALAAQVATGDQYPVGAMSWNNLMAANTGFIDRLNAATESQRPAGWVFTLPTSAQFEYAARGGAKQVETIYNSFPAIAEADAYCWGTSNSGSKTHPVATRKPNLLGLYDMQGNIFEWCLDYKGYNTADSREGTMADYEAGKFAGEYTDPEGPATGTNKWVLSGDYSYTFNTAATTSQIQWSGAAGDGKVTRQDNYIGFRVALVKRKPRVGDLYFSDGTWGTKQEWPVKAAGTGEVKPVGIVFSTATSAKDRAMGYYNGYVMALRFAGTVSSDVPQTFAWSSAALASTNVTTTQISHAMAPTAGRDDLDGLTHCLEARQYVADHSLTMATDLPAINTAMTYDKGAAPAVSSGWYLPSLGQMHSLLQWARGAAPYWSNQTSFWRFYVKSGGDEWKGAASRQAIDTKMTNAGLTAKTHFDPFYTDANSGSNILVSTSTELDASHLWHIYLNGGTAATGTANSTRTGANTVRPVLAF